MNRLSQTTKQLKDNNKTGLVSFTMAGDPSIELSEEIINKLIESGSDIIEIGMPFSDPVADGPAIQQAGIRALKNNIALQDILNLVKNIRKEDNQTPIILMGYFNPIHKYGFELFCKDAEISGVDGLIIVDTPYEEVKKYHPTIKKYNLSLINLVTPLTTEARLEKILSISDSFLYYISICGITGTKKPTISEIETKVKTIKKHTNLPIAVGFGITSKSQIDELKNIADLVIIGSEYCRKISKDSDSYGNIMNEIVKFNNQLTND